MKRFLVLYDGECRLCAGVVRWLMARDSRKRLEFAPIQGEVAMEILRRRGLEAEALKGIWLVERVGEKSEVVWGRSEAAIRVVVALGGVWRVVGVVRVIPRRWREGIYGWVAGNRYRWFGRGGVCDISRI